MMKARFANLFMFMNWHLTFATPNRDRFLFISIDKSLVKKKYKLPASFCVISHADM